MLFLRKQTGIVVLLCGVSATFLWSSSDAFVTSPRCKRTTSPTSLNGMFDILRGGGTADQDDLDEQWRVQQEILKARRAPKEERDSYFEKVEEKRVEATKKQQDMWGWQTKTYAKGEDPINEWKKRRESGQISDLDDQYGDPKNVGGIPIPGASFGVGGEFGVGGKFDNGGRFDLRLPYADQGYVDEEEDVMNKFSNFFAGGKKSQKKEETPLPPAEEPPKKKWPWE